MLQRDGRAAEMLATHIDRYVADEPDALISTSAKTGPLRYLRGSARRDAEIADAIEQRMNDDLNGVTRR